MYQKNKKWGVNCRIEKHRIWNFKLNRSLWQQKTGLVKWKTNNFENSNLLHNAHRVKKSNTEESGNNICEQGEKIYTWSLIRKKRGIEQRFPKIDKIYQVRDLIMSMNSSKKYTKTTSMHIIIGPKQRNRKNIKNNQGKQKL